MRASQPDIMAYRAWMEEHTPVHPSETQYLSSDNEDDLISAAAAPSPTPIPPKVIAPPIDADGVDLKQLIFLLHFTMILLLLAFSMLPDLFSKILLLCVVVGCTGTFFWKHIPFPHGVLDGKQKDA